MPSIAFIFAYKETDKWNTPLSVVEEFKSRGWDTSIYSLFDYSGNYVDDNVYKLLSTKPNVIMHMDWGRHLSPILSKLRDTGAYCIMEAGDDPQNFERNVIKAPWFDLILSPDIRSTNKYKELGYNAKWWTHFADTKIHQPSTVEEKYIAVSSRGKGSSQILDTLADYYSGDIIKLVITDKLLPETQLENLFTDGEDIILYNSLQDCAEKIAYYNNNPEEREKIAWSGYQKVINNHTQKQRVDLIIQQWKNYQYQ
jgi:hypothetical protein